MEKSVSKKVKIISKPSLVNTLMALPLGIKHRFSTRDFKVQAARSAISGLRKKKFEFKISEEGLVNEYDVTRLK